MNGDDLLLHQTTAVGRALCRSVIKCSCPRGRHAPYTGCCNRVFPFMPMALFIDPGARVIPFPVYRPVGPLCTPTSIPSLALARLWN